MKRVLFGIFLMLTIALAVTVPANAQTDAEKEANRAATREKLRTLLANSGGKKGIDIPFKQSDKNPWNFTGMARNNLTYADSYEIVIGVSKDETIGFRIYPIYKGAYINVDKARNPLGLSRQLLAYSNKNFLFWGMDETSDVFAGYTFTLENGFPDKSIDVVLYSIRALDQFIGPMRANIDGSGN